MKRKPDPIFGVKALESLDQNLRSHIKAFPRLKEGPRKRRIKDTELYKQHMRYIYDQED